MKILGCKGLHRSFTGRFLYSKPYPHSPNMNEFVESKLGIQISQEQCLMNIEKKVDISYSRALNWRCVRAKFYLSDGLVSKNIDFLLNGLLVELILLIGGEQARDTE